MKKIIFSCLIMAGAIGSLNAQAIQDSTKSIPKNDLLVGLTMNNSFPNSPSAIMYRRNFKKVSLRIGMHGAYHNRYRAQLDRRDETYILSPFVGIQKNVKIVDNFHFYWGGDLVYSYKQGHRTDSTFERTSQINSIGVSPFVGLRYSYKHLALGIESSGSLSYRFHEQRENSSTPGFIPENFSRASFDFNMFNATKFFIGLTF